MNQTRVMALLCGAISAMFLAACGGNSSNASVGGSVTGLASGKSVSLVDNGANSLTVSANGNFVFAGQLSSQSNYNVTVATQPAGQTCLVSNGSGLIDFSGDNVNNVAISCVANVSVGGVVTGLASGASVTLQNNFTDTLVVLVDGRYAFPTLLTLGGLYNVTVSVQPNGHVCRVGANNSGGVASLSPIPGLVSQSSIPDVDITCL